MGLFNENDRETWPIRLVPRRAVYFRTGSWYLLTVIMNGSGRLHDAFESGFGFSRMHPVSDFVGHHGTLMYSPVKALADQDAEPKFNHVKPTRVSWDEREVRASRRPACPFRRPSIMTDISMTEVRPDLRASGLPPPRWRQSITTQPRCESLAGNIATPHRLAGSRLGAHLRLRQTQRARSPNGFGVRKGRLNRATAGTAVQCQAAHRPRNSSHFLVEPFNRHSIRTSVPKY